LTAAAAAPAAPTRTTAEVRAMALVLGSMVGGLQFGTAIAISAFDDAGPLGSPGCAASSPAL
jgi:hypothetical protein